MKILHLKLKSLVFLMILFSSFIVSAQTDITPEDVNVSVDSLAATKISENKTETIWTRKQLTGDWGGTRSSLKKSGITIKSSFTNFYYFLVSGEGDMEYNMGNSINGNGGTLLPVNTGLAYPGIEGADRFDGSVYFVQFLSKTDKVVLGKMSTRDLTNFSTFSGGGGRTGFQNTAFITAPNGITTPDIFGAAYMSNNEKRDFTFMVYDANSSLNKIGFQDRFQNGVTFFGSADLVVKIAGLKGKQGILGVASTKDVYNTDDVFEILNPNQTSEKKSNRWTLGYYFEQALWQSPTNKKQNLGIYGQLIFTDGEGSPVDYGLVLGLGGKAPFAKRPLDHWGIGYFNYSFSDGLSELNIPTVLKMAAGETGIETYYNAFLTPWFSIGVDFQWIQPGFASQNGVSNSDTAFFGLRSGIIF